MNCRSRAFPLKFSWQNLCEGLPGRCHLLLTENLLEKEKIQVNCRSRYSLRKTFKEKADNKNEARNKLIKSRPGKHNRYLLYISDHVVLKIEKLN